MERYQPKQEEFNVLLYDIFGGMYQCLNDSVFTILLISDSFCEMLGYHLEEIEEFFHGQFLFLIFPQDRERVLQMKRQKMEAGNKMELEYRMLCKDGNLIWVLEKSKYYVNGKGEETFVCLLMDITERKKNEENLNLVLERYKVIMEQTTDIVFEWDMAKDTLFLSANWEKKFGYKAVNSNISYNLLHSLKVYEEDKAALLQVIEDMRCGKNYSEAELRIRNVLGQYRWCRIRATAQCDKLFQPIKAIGLVIDIEEEKKQQQELMKKAQQDALTGLLNKTEVKMQTEQYLNGEENYKKGALLLLDLDNFKQVNDRYGHLCGDAVLSDTAAVLRRMFRISDIIGRIGGDEFMIFVPGAEKRKVKERAETAAQVLKKKHLPNQKEGIGVSIGIAEWPEDGNSFFELYGNADIALYQAKKQGKGSVVLYDRKISGLADIENLQDIHTRTNIDSEEMTDVEEKLGSYTFRMLYHSVDIEEAVGQILEIVGRAYDVSRVYIFENSFDGHYCSNTFEWCNEGVTPQKENLQHMSYEEELNGYRNHFDEHGIFYCQDIKTLTKPLYEILKAQGIKSLLQCAIIDDGEFKGYVGFDECRQNRYWVKEQIKSLGLIANILSEFLIKYRLKERIKELERQMIKNVSYPTI